MMSEDKIEVAKAIWGEIYKSKRILLHLHRNTDGDSVGSCLALKKALETIDKNVDIITGDNKNVPKYLEFLPGVDKISKKKFEEINFSDYDLFISLDSGSAQQISMSEGFEVPEETIVIDHHRGNKGYGMHNLIDATYTSTCELLCDFLKLKDIVIDPYISVCLYVGICTDTGNFLYPPVNYKTIEKAAKLAEISSDTIVAANRIASSISKEEFMANQIALRRLDFRYSSKIAITWVKESELLEKNCFSEDFGPSGVASLLSKIEGVVAGICLYQVGKDVRISFRSKSNGGLNVRVVAECFAIGGGHDAAAGATFSGSIEEAINFLDNSIIKLYPDLV